MPGVRIRDLGVKIALNGIDNGTLAFNQVRVPRENLLNRYSDVDEDGNFTSSVSSISSRFFQHTERLLSGRLCIASACMGAMRAAIYIAIKYSK